jgi:hypothetical protein
MLRFMARENSEEYGSEFLVMLNTWEAGVKFLAHPVRQKTTLEIALFLGWALLRNNESRKGDATASPVARACAAAYTLIESNYVKREDLEGLTVAQAMELLERAAAHAKALPQGGGGDAEFTAGVKETIKQVKAGDVAKSEIRKVVDKNTGRESPRRKPAKEKPLFSKFAKKLRASIGIAFESDAMSKCLQLIEEAQPHVTLREDRELIADILHGLGKVEDRIREWRTKRLVFKKVTPLRAIEKKETE